MPLLSQEDLVKLKDNLSSGPYEADVREYLKSSGYAQIADLYNARRGDFGVSESSPLMSMPRLATFLAKTGLRAKIRALSLDIESPFQSICLTIEDMLNSLSGPPIDLSDKDVREMLGYLVQGKIMSPEEEEALLSMVTKTRYPASAAELLYGAGVLVSPEDVRLAVEMK